MNVAARHAVRRNRTAELHYFDPDTLEFFGSIVHNGYNHPTLGTFVVMSNRDRDGMVLDGVRYYAHGGVRHYYVVNVSPSGRTTNVSHGHVTLDEMPGWETITTADNYARALAAGSDRKVLA